MRMNKNINREIEPISMVARRGGGEEGGEDDIVCDIRDLADWNYWFSQEDEVNKTKGQKMKDQLDANLNAIFEDIDGNGDGKIYPEELKIYLGSLGKYGNISCSEGGISEDFCEEGTDTIEK